MKKDQNFYQAKFNYYRSMNLWIAVACCISSVTYVFSDWMIFKGFNPVTLPARLFILVPFSVFLIVNRKVTDYRIMVPFTYLLAHTIVWCTIWACYHLPDLTFASDGFILLMATFIVFSIAAPYKWACFFTGLIFIDISIANTFLHYPEFKMMLTLGVPFYLGICLYVWANEKTFVDQYSIKSKLENSAMHDQLTGIYNRNIMETLTDSSRIFKNYKKDEISILIFDIDFFKKVNDTYGHDSGDIVLKEVAELAEKNLRKTDYLIRWGGEEFVIIMEAPIQAALKKAEEIRSQIQEYNGSICSITVSGGVCPYLGGDYTHTIQKADEALYKAKNEGRNKIELATID